MVNSSQASSNYNIGDPNLSNNDIVKKKSPKAWKPTKFRMQDETRKTQSSIA